MVKIGNLLLFFVLVSVLSVCGYATPMHSDNFDDGVIDSQWSKKKPSSYDFNLYESGGKLHIDLPTSGNPKYTVIGVQSATGYTISGDFDISIKLDWESYSGTNIRSRVQFYVDGNNTLTLDHFFVGGSPGRKEEATVRIGGSNNKTTTYLGYDDHEVRITRTGSDVAIYSRAYGNTTWILRNSGTGFPTGDGTINIGVSLPASNTWVDLGLDDFVVPEPATIGLLTLGLGLFYRR